MKTLVTLILVVGLMMPTFAQQADSTTVENQEFESLINDIAAPDEVAEIDGLSDTISADAEKKDTIHMRFGKHHVEIVSGDKKAHIDVEELDDFESKWDDYDMQWDYSSDEKPHRHHKKDFDGHWGGIDFGGNLLLTDFNGVNSYSMYPAGTAHFLDPRPEKSFEFNLNFAEYSFGFGSYVGIVTGLGLNFNDYKFKNKIRIAKDENGMIQPIDLPEEDFRKSKLSTVFLTAPLMLEVQIPGNYGKDRLFLAAGVIGGLKLGEHTKYKIGDKKIKDKGDLNINPLRWGYTARVGFEDFGVFATYYNTPLFEDGKGPTVTPLTIGVTLTFD